MKVYQWDEVSGLVSPHEVPDYLIESVNHEELLRAANQWLDQQIGCDSEVLAVDHVGPVARLSGRFGRNKLFRLYYHAVDSAARDAADRDCREFCGV